MQNSKLISLLRTLKKEELKALDKFLQSPYHNSSQKLLTFFRLINKHYKNDFTNSRLDKEKIFKKLYPNAPVYQDSNIRNLMALLKQQIEQFLFIEMVQKEEAIFKEKFRNSRRPSE